MIRVGIVGLGFMGRMHYRCWSAIAGARVTAICEASPKVLAAASETQEGNIGGAAEVIDLSSVEVFSDLGQLLASESIDAVSITLPTFLHADTTIRALKAGIHVLCEKPMALTEAECEEMAAAARETGKCLQIGHCIRFWPEYTVAREIIGGGAYGKVIAASFRRFGSMPSWSLDRWFADEARSGGQPLDLHIHDSDYIHQLFGMPESVSSVADEAQSYIATQYHYVEGPSVVAEGTWRMMPSFGFEMSFVIVLEKGTIVYDSTRTPAFRVMPCEGEVFTPAIPTGDGYSREVEHFARWVGGEPVEPIVTAEQSAGSVRLVLAEKRSAREKRLVKLE